MPSNNPKHLALLFSPSKDAIPLVLCTEASFKRCLKAQHTQTKNWLNSRDFTAKPGKAALVPDPKSGNILSVLVVLDDAPNLWSLAHLQAQLPPLVFKLDDQYMPKIWQSKETHDCLSVGWALATYQYDHFKKDKNASIARLCVAKHADKDRVMQMIEATTLVRDLINAPVNIMGPSELTHQATQVAQSHKAKHQVIEGEKLLKENYPLIHAVGRACDDPPKLVDIRWGKASHPKITLVGKGVCFDTGGLDIKSSSNMKLMKKDMGGAAHVLGLAHLVMAAKLPVRLRVLVPIVENSIAGNAFRTSDVITSRKGSTVEIGNTDAEGRLILCDALTEADSESPDLLIDCATLTGAARVALGTDMPAFFTPSDTLANRLMKASQQTVDPVWRLPLYEPYEDNLNTSIADISSTGSSRYGGAITAALFLKHFVEKTEHWVHLDMMAWNLKKRPGRPVGGEAMGMRALFELVKHYL